MGSLSPLDHLIEAAGSDERVLAVILFGSAARGEARADSDLDVCLLLAPEQARDPAHVRLDYLSRFDSDIQVLDDLPLHVRSRVLREGRVLLVKDEDALYAIAAQIAQEFEDFKPYYHRYLDAVLHGRP